MSCPSVSEAASGAILTIDLDALAENYRRLEAVAAPAECGAVVKADAYGIGAREVVPVLLASGCRHFFVAQLSEGLEMAPLVAGRAGITVMNGLQPGSEIEAAEAGLRPVLNGLEQVRAYAALGRRLERDLDAAIQIDSGMSRLGLGEEEVAAIEADPRILEGLSISLVMSHFACADDPEDPYTAAQQAAFERDAARLPQAPLSLANSGGVFRNDTTRFDVVRPGVALYGVAPLLGRANPMRPVVTLEAKVVQVRQVPIGTPVGYARTLVTTQPSRLATIAVGYADGWPRSLSGRGAAYFDGVRLPIAGRVSMDSIILDVTALPEGALSLGSLVELIGPNQTLEMVAGDAGTIPYEILTGLGRRYHRRHVRGAPSTELRP